MEAIMDVQQKRSPATAVLSPSLSASPPLSHPTPSKTCDKEVLARWSLQIPNLTQKQSVTRVVLTSNCESAHLSANNV